MKNDLHILFSIFYGSFILVFLSATAEMTGNWQNTNDLQTNYSIKKKKNQDKFVIKL